nr:MAG TPA: hypothetical protein [Caudoviricetes sp.]
MSNAFSCVFDSTLLFCIYRVLAHPSTYGRRVDYAKISDTV